jgi:hypothetical protein
VGRFSNAHAADWTSASVASRLSTEKREPPQRGALEPIRLDFLDRVAHRESVARVDTRQLARGSADDGHVARLQRVKGAD